MNLILEQLDNNRYIKRLNNIYEFSFCHKTQLKDIISFINEHWQKDHILSISKIMMNWQHWDEVNNRYNFVLAIHKQTNQIHGVLGFILTEGNNDCLLWPAIWKSLDSIAPPGLGIALYNFLQNNIKIDVIIASGVGEKARGLYDNLGFKVEVLDQWYMLNNKINNFSLVDNITDANISKNNITKNDCKLQVCDLAKYQNLALNLEFSPYKTIQYYIDRFYKHPIYDYQAYSVTINNETKAIIFIRSCDANGSTALRIVDYIGDHNAISGCGNEFSKLLDINNAEYIDFMNIGFDQEALINCGFQDRKQSDIVIPNYFEPFCKQNIDVYYAFKSTRTNTPCIIFKADADQDRPSKLKGFKYDCKK